MLRKSVSIIICAQLSHKYNAVYKNEKFKLGGKLWAKNDFRKNTPHSLPMARIFSTNELNL